MPGQYSTSDIQTSPPQTGSLSTSDIQKIHPGMSDDDVIKAYGYDPAEIKKSHLYVRGHLANQASDSTQKSPDYINKLVEGAGEGLYSIPAGLFQLAVHGANKLGLASDSDVKYNDLLEKVHHDAYLLRTGGDPSKLGELAGTALIPVPGRAAKTLAGALLKGGATGAAFSATQPVTSDTDNYFAQKAKQTETGAAVGAATGGLLHGALSSVGKATNYGSTKLPEEIASDLQAKADVSSADAKKAADNAAGKIMQEKALTQQAADEAAGKVTQAKADAQAQLQASAANRLTAATGVQDAQADLIAHRANIAQQAKEAQDAYDEAARVQATGVGSKASLATTNLRNAMGSTPFSGTQDLVDAAAKGDGRAGAVLKQMQDAGDNPDKIQQASIQLQNWRTRQVASDLYDRVDDIAKASDLDDVVMARTNAALRMALREADSAKIPDKSLVNTLSTIKDNINTKIVDGQPVQPDNSYGSIRKFDDDLGQLIRSGQKGTNALVNDTQVPVLNQLRQAVRADLDGFTSSNPQLQDAAKAADDYYKNVRVPFKQSDIAKAGSATDADTIYDGLIRTGGGDKAQRYYNALDDKGRAAVRYQMATDATNAATDPLRGTFDPEKFYNALNKVSDAHGVFFSGSDKAEMDGLKNLAQQATLTRDAAKTASSDVAESLVSATQLKQEAIVQAKKQAASARLSDLLTKRGVAQGLTQATNQAQAQAEDIARSSQGRQQQISAGAEDIARRAILDKAAADKAAQDAKDAISSIPYGKLAGALGASSYFLGRSGMHTAAEGAAGMGTIALGMKFLTQTQAGRRFLAASSQLPVGSPQLQDVLGELSKRIPGLTAKQVTGQ